MHPMLAVALALMRIVRQRRRIRPRPTIWACSKRSSQSFAESSSLPRAAAAEVSTRSAFRQQ